MCGRLTCIYSKFGIQDRCRYQENGKPNALTKPIFHKCTYKASYNMGPGKMVPVLVQASNVLSKIKSNERCLVAMQFGLVRSLPTTNRVINARSETLRDKPMFNSLLNKGQRCVIACNGFFEWKKTKGKSVPYFFYSTRFTDLKKSLKNDFAKDTLTYLAGLYEYRPKKENDAISGNGYYFVIITSNPNSMTKPIHDRMPVVLNSEKDIDIWLDSETYNPDLALKLLKPCKPSDIDYYQVSQIVNNANNDQEECILPLDESNQKGTIDKYFKKEVKKETIEYKPVKKREARSLSRNNSASSKKRKLARKSRSISSKRKRNASRSTSSYRNRQARRSTSTQRKRKASRSASSQHKRKANMHPSSQRKRKASRSTSSQSKRKARRVLSSQRRRKTSRSVSSQRKEMTSRSSISMPNLRRSRSTGLKHNREKRLKTRLASGQQSNRTTMPSTSNRSLKEARSSLNMSNQYSNRKIALRKHRSVSRSSLLSERPSATLNKRTKQLKSIPYMKRLTKRSKSATK
ncbi:hypothetical protein GJ496_010983 [Pomphorhynchus laevis]|nr:hypothetical protein GJ496_010983 [Pomphorhynchus laevis]